MFRTIENFKNQMNSLGSQVIKHHFSKSLKDIETNTAIIEDDQGRRLRWEFSKEAPPIAEKNCFGCEQQMAKHDYDKLFLVQTQYFTKRLYQNIEVREKAIANWKKLRILLVLFRICGGNQKQQKMLMTMKTMGPIEEKKLSCKERFE